jgi:hypothetical protein
MFTPTGFHRLYRLSAIYDILLSAPFALYPGAHLVLWALDRLSTILGLAPIPPLDPLGMMYANFFGTVVTIWGILRLKLDLPWLARWDAVGRMTFSLAMATALANGATPILWPVLAIELTWGLLQLLPVKGRPWRDPGFSGAA